MQQGTLKMRPAMRGPELVSRPRRLSSHHLAHPCAVPIRSARGPLAGARRALGSSVRCAAQREVSASAAASFVETAAPANGSSAGQHEDAASAPRDDPQAARDNRTFTWARNWYAIAPASVLDKERPSAHTVLGNKLAVWYNADKQTWNVFDDACPHRLASLSEGRVQGSNLVCSYHGWSFGPEGACNKIPQIDLEGQARACSNPRTCVTSYPTLVQNGLLYVWMDPTPEGVKESKTRGPPDLGAPDDGSWVSMEWPNDWRFWMEQAMDPSHANHLHAGFFKPEDSIAMVPYNTPDVHPTEGFVYTHGGYEKRNATMFAKRQFVPPGNIIVTYQQAAFTMVLDTILTPVKPGVTRSNWRIQFLPAGSDPELITDSVRKTKQTIPPRPAPAAPAAAAAPAAPKDDKADTKPKPKAKFSPLSLFLAVSKALPHWASITYGLGDQDAVALYYQGRNMDEKRLTDNDYVMPAVGADLGVAAVSRWMRMVGYPRSLYGSATVSEDLSLEQVLDRNRRHVRFCTVCQQGLKIVTRVCWTVSLLAAVSAVFAISSAASALVNTGGVAAAGWPALIATVSAPVLGVLASKLWAAREDKFISGVQSWTKCGGLSKVPRA